MTEPAVPAAEIRAVCYDEDGFVMTDEEIDAWCRAWGAEEEGSWSPVPTEMVIVTGSALPRPEPGVSAEKGPGTYHALDVIAEWDLTIGVEGDEVKPRWDMAKKIAAALNG